MMKIRKIRPFCCGGQARELHRLVCFGVRKGKLMRAKQNRGIRRRRAVAAVAAKRHAARGKLDADLMSSPCVQMDTKQRIRRTVLDQLIVERCRLDSFSLTLHNKGFSSRAIVKEQIGQRSAFFFGLSAHDCQIFFDGASIGNGT